MPLPPEEMTYYEQWGPIARHVRAEWDFLSVFWKKDIILLAEARWRLGDEIMMIPVYESISRAVQPESFFGKRLQIIVWCNYPELLEDNPFVSAVNVTDFRPQAYRLLKGAPRDKSREFHYKKMLSIKPHPGYRVFPRPTLHYKDWSTPLLDDIPAGDGPVVALCRGASWETKRWPEENWLALGQTLEAEGCRVIVLGQDGEGIDVGTDFCGRTGVRDAACLLHHADLTISNDSGLMHLSLAAGTETIGLFGPTDPAILIEDDERFHPITNARECQGCWNNDLGIEEPGSCPKDIKGCMDVIAVEQVLSAVREILGESPGSSA